MSTLTQWADRAGLATPDNYKVLAGPVLIIMIMAMMILPLPPIILDLLFTFNIALSVLVLLVAMFTTRPLDFMAFPAVLLFATLLRLSLNVASTRVVLMEGHSGAGAAGQVIESFGEFLVGGDLAVGLIVFLILIVINFMVITKGAGRIAEVGARFTLDSLPGKQMAIDADVNAGTIDEHTAKKRREETAMEADFYGSMDGASKFVRGDAIAGILIMGINLVGGLIVGMVQHDMSAGAAARSYTILTIGDGLVAQVPALVISTAAGVTVSRVSGEQDVGQQMIGQLFNKPVVLFLAASVIGLLGLVPGMPNLVFLGFASGLGFIGWWLLRYRTEQPIGEDTPEDQPDTTNHTEDASWRDVEFVDALRLEVGYRLIGLVDEGQDGSLLRRIKGVRKKFAADVGFLPPIARIKDNLKLSPHSYRITLSGVEIGRGEVFVDQMLAIDPGNAFGEIEGQPGVDPAFGLPATWIKPDKQDEAEAKNFTVVDPATVVATHLNHLLGVRSHELLGRQEVSELLERVKGDFPGLVDEVTPEPVPLATLTSVLQNLLKEGVSIRDMRKILDTLAVHGHETKDSRDLTAAVRDALGPAIVADLFGNQDPVGVITLEGELERMLENSLSQGGPVEPNLAQTLFDQTGEAVRAQKEAGQPGVLVVRQPLRATLARFMGPDIPGLTILSQTELPDDRNIQSMRQVGANSGA